MTVIDIEQPGGPERLVVSERPIPEVGPKQVLIAIAAAGLNRADILQRQGKYPPPAGAPSYPGLEVAGTVAATGSEVSHLRTGDRVCALLQGGGYAEYCSIDAAQVLPIPGTLDFIEASTLPEAYFTVWNNVFDIGGLRPGGSILIHGGTSGIGVAAIQLASAMGCTVFATAGSETKCAFSEALGARHAIDYKRLDFAEEVVACTSGRGVDVVLDLMGASYLERNTRVLAPGGTLVVIAVQGGTKAPLDLLRMLQRGLKITGSALRGQSVEYKARIREQLEAHVWPLIEAGKIKPVVDRVFALRDAAAAHAYMESGVHKGKIVLSVP